MADNTTDDALQKLRLVLSAMPKLDDRVITIRAGWASEIKSAAVKDDEDDGARDQARNLEQADADDDSKQDSSVRDENNGDTSSDSDSDSDPYSYIGRDLDTAAERPLTFLERIYHEDEEDDKNDEEDGGYTTEDQSEEEASLELSEDEDDEYTYHESEEEVVEYADSDGFWGHTFYVHEGVLRANSPFFDRALQLHWQEGKRGVVHLPKAEKEIFEIYAKWLYTGRIFEAWHWRWSKCYELGEYLCDADFKDALVDYMIGCLKPQELPEREMPIREMYEALYAMSQKDSPHRKLAVDVFVKELHSGSSDGK